MRYKKIKTVACPQNKKMITKNVKIIEVLTPGPPHEELNLSLTFLG
jgi:hypothetical protein